MKRIYFVIFILLSLGFISCTIPLGSVSDNENIENTDEIILSMEYIYQDMTKIKPNIYISKLSEMKTNSNSTLVINNQPISSNITLEAGWYTLGARSNDYGWLPECRFQIKIGDRLSPANLGGFQKDKNQNYQWFITIKTDGSISSGLVTY